MQERFGKSTQNAYVESFNGRFREECQERFTEEQISGIRQKPKQAASFSRMTISTATRRSSSEEEEATLLLSFFVTPARSGFAVLLKRPPGPRLTQARLDFSMKCLKHKQIQGPWCITSDTAQRIVFKTLVDS